MGSGDPREVADGDLIDARSRNQIACLKDGKDGEVLAKTMPHTKMLSWPLQVGCVAMEVSLDGPLAATRLFQ